MIAAAIMMSAATGIALRTRAGFNADTRPRARSSKRPCAACMSAAGAKRLPARPVAFMVTSLPGDQGAGLFAVLDYQRWWPDRILSAVRVRQTAVRSGFA